MEGSAGSQEDVRVCSVAFRGGIQDMPISWDVSLK